MPTFRLTVDSLDPYEAGASVTTAYIWPELISDHHAMGLRHAAVCQLYLQDRRYSSDWSETEQWLKPMYLLQPAPQVEAFRKQWFRRSLVRDQAAKMAIGLLMAEAQVLERLPSGMDRPSLNQFAELVLPYTEESDAQNVKSRVWRASRPVLNIACALQMAMHFCGPDELTHGTLMGSPDVLRYVVNQSRHFAKALALLKKCRFDEQEFVNYELKTVYRSVGYSSMCQNNIFYR